MTEDVLADFLVYTSKRKSPKTAKAYWHTVSRYLAFCDGNIDATTARDFLFEFEKKAASPQSIRRHLAALKYFFRYIEQNKALDDIEVPRATHPVIYTPTRDEVNALISACRNLKERTMVSLLYSCALRAGELLRIKVEDLNTQAGFLGVHTEKKRTTEDVVEFIPIDETVLEIARKYASLRGITSGLIFPGVTYRMVLHVIESLSKRAKIHKLATHSLRHARASHLAEDGVQPLTLQRFMRHSSFSSTEKYIHISNDALASGIKPAFNDDMKAVKTPTEPAKKSE